MIVSKTDLSVPLIPVTHPAQQDNLLSARVEACSEQLSQQMHTFLASERRIYCYLLWPACAATCFISGFCCLADVCSGGQEAIECCWGFGCLSLIPILPTNDYLDSYKTSPKPAGNKTQSPSMQREDKSTQTEEKS